ncbi:MAG: hypothetical protein ACHQRM_13365 [Bacteroidia bacterium]
MKSFPSVMMFLLSSLWSGYSFSQNSNQKTAYSDEQLLKILDKKSYPHYAEDQEALKKMKSVFIHDGNSYNPKTDVEKLGILKWTKAKLDSIASTYAEYWRIYEEQMKKKEDLDYQYSRLKKEIKEFETHLGAMEQGGENAVVAGSQTLDKALEKAKTKADILTTDNYKKLKYSEKEDYVRSQWDRVEDELETVRFRIALLTYRKGGNDGGVGILTKKMQEAETEIQAVRKDFDTKMLETCKADLDKVKLPAEVYAGADKEKLRTYLKTEWSKSVQCKECKLMKVVFNHPAWEQKKGREYKKHNDQVTGTDINYSFLEVTVVFQRSGDIPEVLSMFEAEISKDNINKTMEAGFICGDPRSFKKILAKNVK